MAHDTEHEWSAPREASWLPEGALPCLWMKAGLLVFKLCEHEYDCEHCPLDAALAGVVPEQAFAPAEPLEPTRTPLEFRADRSYHRSHGWVLPISATRVRYGLDMFAGRLLDHPTAVVLPSVGSRLRRGRPGCWLKGEGELFPLAAPITGVVTAANARLQEHPALLATSPYDDGWLLEMRCDGRALDATGLLSAERMRHETSRDLRKLQAQVRKAAKPDPRVGVTLADGGRRVRDLRRLLGASRWRRAIETVLG